MRSPAEHFHEAEQALEHAAQAEGDTDLETYWLQRALVHATLATTTRSVP